MQVSIPTHLSAITVEQYQKYEAVANGENDEDFIIFKTIEIFCDIPIQTVSKFPMQDAKDIYEQIQGVLSQDAKFSDTFEMDGIEYGFIPSLEELTLGEYIDLEAGLKDTKDLHKAAAVMFRPISRRFKELYDIEPYQQGTKSWELMKGAPIDVISSAVVFFYNLGNELLMDSLAYLSKKEKETLKKSIIQQRDSFQLNGDGLTPFGRLQKVMSQNLKV